VDSVVVATEVPSRLGRDHRNDRHPQLSHEQGADRPLAASVEKPSAGQRAAGRVHDHRRRCESRGRPAEFASGHLRGAVNVGLTGRFAEWAGDVLDPNRDVVLVGDPTLAREAKVRLARVGYDNVVGRLADPAEVFATRPELRRAVPLARGGERVGRGGFADVSDLLGGYQAWILAGLPTTTSALSAGSGHAVAARAQLGMLADIRAGTLAYSSRS